LRQNAPFGVLAFNIFLAVPTSKKSIQIAFAYYIRRPSLLSEVSPQIQLPKRVK